MTAPRELPTGTLTFLFTDIEGSTQLINALGERFRAAIEDHHRILRAAIADHEGQQARLEGDSFFVVFTSAARAVAAAVDAQRALAQHNWTAARPIRVRMGLHTGEAALGGGDYVGIDVHRAARIASAAHGGQILISETTRALIVHTLSDGVALRDLGEFHLKDLGNPEHLYQLVVEGLPSEFPPPRALDSTPNNLPTQLTSFVGRDRELAEGVRQMAGTRLLTLTGPGGMGKTRLSLRLAAEIAEQFADGAFFVPLAPVFDPALLPSTIAQMLGVHESGGQPIRDRLLDYVRDKVLLLVLDNFEQILPGAGFVGELLHAAPKLKVIVTSRAPLRIYGEHEFQVPPLGLPDPRMLPATREALSQYEAVNLFIERAMAVKPDFQVTNTNAPAIAEICVRLDGLPLAIELAAARVKLLNPEAMLRRLEHRLGFLGMGPRDLPARQQTLRGAIAWSFDMLDEDGRRLFARFAVFVGGADLERAEMVCGPSDEVGGDVLDGLAVLVDNSLLVQHERDGEPRLYLLETIREFALEQLEESGESDEIRNRHLATYLELAERAAPELTGDQQKFWLDTLEREHDNIRAALEFAVGRRMASTATRMTWAVWRFWQMRGHLDEGRVRTREVVGLAHAPDHPRELARAYEAAGSIEYWAGNMDSAASYYRQALQVSRDIGDEALIANALYNYSFTYAFGSSNVDVPKSISLLEEALERYRAVHDAPGVAKVLWALGNSLFATQNYRPAKQRYEEALAMFRAAGDRFHMGWALYELGVTRIRLGELAEARLALEEGVALFAEASDISGVVLLLDALSELREVEGDMLQAIRLAAAAEGLQRSSGTNLATLSNVYAGRQRPTPMSAEESAAWAEGQALTLDQAVALALRHPEAVAPASSGKPGKQ